MQALKNLIYGAEPPKTRLELLPLELLNQLTYYVEGSEFAVTNAHPVFVPVFIELDSRLRARYANHRIESTYYHLHMARRGLLDHLRHFAGEWGAQGYAQHLLDSCKHECIEYVFKHCWFISRYRLAATISVELYKLWKDRGFQLPTLYDIARVDNLELFKHLFDVNTWRILYHLAPPEVVDCSNAMLYIIRMRKWRFIEYVASHPSLVANILSVASGHEYTEEEKDKLNEILSQYAQEKIM